jgi:hypothetical protein
VDRRGRAGRAGRRPGCSAAASPASGSASSAWAASAGRCPPRQGLRPVDPLSQPPPVGPAIEEQLEATYWDSLDQMLARMDIVSVNCPSHAGHLPPAVGPPPRADEAGAYIVNTARGEVIDENALIRAARRRLSRCRARCVRTRTGGQPRLLGSPKARWCCCRTWARPPSRAGSTWARRSSSTSRPSPTATARPTAWKGTCGQRRQVGLSIRRFLP